MLFPLELARTLWQTPPPALGDTVPTPGAGTHRLNVANGGHNSRQCHSEKGVPRGAQDPLLLRSFGVRRSGGQHSTHFLLHDGVLARPQKTISSVAVIEVMAENPSPWVPISVSLQWTPEEACVYS